MLIETPTTTLATPTASCERPAEVWRHQSPNQQRALSTPSATIKCKYPSLPNPSIYSLNIRARRGGGEAVCAPWGRWCFAPQPLLGPCHDRRCRASSVHSHFHSPHRVPSPRPTPLLFLKAACSIKRLARGGAQLPPEWRGQCRRACIPEGFGSRTILRDTRAATAAARAAPRT